MNFYPKNNFDPKINFEPKIYSTPKYFWSKKYFWLQKYFWSQNLRQEELLQPRPQQYVKENLLMRFQMWKSLNVLGVNGPEIIKVEKFSVWMASHICWITIAFPRRQDFLRFIWSVQNVVAETFWLMANSRNLIILGIHVVLILTTGKLWKQKTGWNL